MFRLARYSKSCNGGTYILELTKSYLIGLKTHSTGGNSYIEFYNVYRHRPFSVSDEAMDPRGESATATFLISSVIPNCILSSYPYTRNKCSLAFHSRENTEEIYFITGTTEEMH